MWLRWVLPLVLVLLIGAGAHAQQAEPPADTALKVGLLIEPPFVQPVEGGYSGMAVELWQRVADKEGLDYTYQTFPNVHDLLAAVTARRVDIAVAALTVTEDRLKRMDFTQPWHNAGLRVMIEENRSHGFREVLRGLYDRGHLRVYLWIVGIVLGATLLLTIIDRILDEEFPRSWHEGLAESFYHVMSVATSGKANHKHMFGVAGRVLAALWMVCGVTLVAYVTSTITSVMTANALTSQIHDFADLDGRTVGVLKGSVGESYSRDRGLGIVSYDNLQQAVTGLLEREVLALVADGPMLEYFDRTHPELPITEVGATVRREMLAFALPQGSALVRPISVSIIAATEDGFVDRLRQKYLGSE